MFREADDSEPLVVVSALAELVPANGTKSTDRMITMPSSDLESI